MTLIGVLLEPDGGFELDAATAVIRKPDRRYKPVRYHDAVETEALGQSEIVAIVRDHLDHLLPEPIGDVLERERRERGQVARLLAEIKS